MKPLVTASIAAPGFFGLNTQEASTTLEGGFSLVADNCIIDEQGRLGSRKGWSYITSGSDGVALTGAHEFTDIDGIDTLICWSATGFYTSAGDTLTPITYTGANTLDTGNWEAATLNDTAYFFQTGKNPMMYDNVSGQLSDALTTIQPNTVISAYGRLWAADTTANKTTVYWSNLLDGSDFTTGTAGSIDLSAVLVYGNDSIVSLGAHNGRLIIFCKNNIIIYSDNDSDTILDPVTMRLVEVINGVGCVARDSVQNTGQDIVFLSSDGLRSLGRTIQEKSQPMRDLSMNIRDDLVRLTRAVDPSTIKSIHSPQEAFYLLLFPEFNRVYCFDLRQQLQNGSARVTTWDNQTQTSMAYANSGIIFTNTNGIASYMGYADNGSSYIMKFYSNHLDFGDSTKTLYVKRLNITLISGSGQNVIFKAGYDYSNQYQSFSLDQTERINSEYGIAEYNEGFEYTTGTLVDTLRASIGGSGNVVQVGIEATVLDLPVSLQRLDIYIKEGRVY